MCKKIQVTAGFLARAWAELLASPKTTPEERERIIEEMRAIAQSAADAGLVDLVRSDDLPADQR